MKKVEISQTELTLAFYMAHMVLDPRISSSNTILGYETDVKYMFREYGCHPAEYNTPFLGQLRKGFRNTLPEVGYKRRAFRLPLYLGKTGFLSAYTKAQRLLRFATMLGFTGILRPHTLSELTISKVTLVTTNNQTVKLPGRSHSADIVLSDLRSKTRVLGFFIEFKSKTMRNAKAFFPNLCSPLTEYAGMCPTRALVEIVSRGFTKGMFLKSVMCGARLTSYLKELANCDSKITPYALRIGARTWLISQGLERQFVDFLGTWASPEASARYYRANPATVLKKIQRFYAELPNPTML